MRAMTKESLAILVEQARSFLDRQWDAFESQDRKIAGLFALSTGLITIVPTIVSSFGEGSIGWRLTPFALSGVAYLAALYLHWMAYRPGDVHLIGNARAYLERWAVLGEEDVLRWTLLDLAVQQENNERELDLKRRRLNGAAVAVAAEAIFLVAGTLTVAA